MKKRIFILILCVILLTSLLSLSSSASGGVNFVAVNDILPRELVNCYTVYGGTLYVPCWIFNAYSLGIYYSYIETNNTAHLYQGNSQLFFEVDTGLTYDGNDNFYSLPGIIRNGTIYVPLSYVSAFFGTFYFSQVSTPYGSLLRLKDSRVVLSDSEFVQAADPQLRQYYKDFKPAETPSPTPSTVPDHEGTELMLSFVGLPGEAYFELLSNYGVKACFFLSAEDVLASPDTVRRIDSCGHSIGVLCGENPKADYERCSRLIFEAARVRSILVNAPEEYAEACEAFAEENGLAYCPRGTDFVHTPEDKASPYVVTSALDASEYGTSLFIGCGEGMDGDARVILGFLHQSKYEIFPPSEIKN